MASNPAKSAAAAAGITLMSLGGVSFLKDAHILDQGEFSLVHNEFGAGAGRVTVSDGGVDLSCSARWTIDPFAESSSGGLEKDGVQPKGPDGVELAGPALKGAVDKIAKDFQSPMRSGDLLVLGSSNSKPYKPGQGTNEDLALRRAQMVAKLLSGDLPKVPKRNVVVANDKMTFAQTAAAEDGQIHPTNDGLARALFGAKESAGKSVLICMLEPQPHGVSVDSDKATGRSGFLDGLVTGMTTGLVLIVVLWPAGVYFRDWVKKKLKKPRPDEDTPAIT